jgi:hypothetical protein
MGRLLRGLAVLAALAGVDTAQAAKPPGCATGATLFVQDKVRILGLPFDTREETGYSHHACRPRGRALEVGNSFSTPGTASARAEGYALGGGGRFLGSFLTSDGEGGPSGRVVVVDLSTRRSISYLNAACCEGPPRFLVAADGTSALIDDEVIVHRPGAGGPKKVSTPGTLGVDLAIAGPTVYWTERREDAVPTTRSLTLEGVSGKQESTLLAPVRDRRRSACPRLAGRTVAASPSIRVVVRAGAYFACRGTASSGAAVGIVGGTVPRILEDRWVMAYGESGAAVLDIRSREPAVLVDGPVRAATLLTGGTLAWMDERGRLRAQRPGAAVTELAPAEAAASALAGGRKTVFWTAGGVAQSYSGPF